MLRDKRSLKKSQKNIAASISRTSVWQLFIIPAALIYSECLIKICTKDEFTFAGIFLIAAGSLCIGAFLDIFCSLTKSPLVNGWICFAFLEISTLLYSLFFFVQNSYGIYMDLSTISKGAGDVVNGFGDVILNVFRNGAGLMLVFHIPEILYLFAFLFLRIVRFKKYSFNVRIKFILTAIVCLFICIIFCVLGNERKYKMSSMYSFDSVTRQYSLQSACAIDFSIKMFSSESVNYAGFIIDNAPDSANKNIADETAEYGYNIMGLDFDSLSDSTNSSVLKSINEYVSGLTGTRKNQYTGLFEGKNLILICAESFEGAIIDEELTPALYRLLKGGIQVNDYYMPQWSGNTTNGEVQFLTGEWPAMGYSSMQYTSDKNMYFTIGNQLQRLGYTSFAFHNGDYDYYNRYITHPNLGYSDFIAIGSGMEDALTRDGKYAWPQSDLEMMEFAVNYFIDSSPFSIYFMTLSGHSTYNWDNRIAAKNKDAVSGLDYSEAVKAYIAVNMELEYAMEYLLDSLEKAGIINDTVIVITADHYPYGLNYSYAWNTNEEYLSELFGYYPDTTAKLHKNELILWCGELENSDEKITVDTPVSPVDILPTLSNLFGVEYDSRLLIGRDILDEDSDPLVLFSDYSWLTDMGYFDSESWTFTANGEINVPDNYVDSVLRNITNKMTYCKNIQTYDYFGYLFGYDEDN